MKHELHPLPYPQDALGTAISGKTLEYHYGKHYAAYVNNLNNLIRETPFENMPLEEIILKSEGGIFNNAAQAWNHAFYFEALSPDKGKAPSGKILKAIEKKWGSFQKFEEEFSAAAAGLFGSGWVWLVRNNAGELSILKESNAGNPMTQGLVPLLVIDVWEHAYYLDYQNRRAEYIHAFMTLIDWDVVEKRF